MKNWPVMNELLDLDAAGEDDLDLDLDETTEQNFDWVI
jgi:hypothetical protein